jgi:hypothetical protein
VVADKICPDIGEILLGLRLRFVLADFDEQDLFRLLQEWERVPHRAPALARILPSDDHAAKRQRSDGVGHQQNRPAGPQYENPGVGVILAAPAADDEEIRRARFAQEQLAERFKGAAPLDPLERAALGAKRLAPLIETRRHLLKVVLVGFGQPDIPGHERRPQRVPRNPDKGSLEAVGQADRQFNPPLRIVLDVDVDHQR